MIGILIQGGECDGTSLTITGMKHGIERQYLVLVASYFFVTNVHAHTFVTKTVQR